jgi:hypothetical protein
MANQPTPQQLQNFLDRQPLDGVALAHDDLVVIGNGEHAGNVGSILALVALGDDPVYRVEIDSGFEVDVVQSNLMRADE